MKIKTFLLILFISATAFAQNKPSAGGPPTKDQIVGFWKMVNFEGRDRMNKVDPWPEPYQWFAFYENGTVHSMMTSKDENYTAAELQQIFQVLPAQGTPTYKYNGRFLIIKNADIPDYQEVWGMNLFAKDVGTKVKSGDMMMSLDDQEGNGNESIIYYRLLRRIE